MLLYKTIIVLIHALGEKKIEFLLSFLLSILGWKNSSLSIGICVTVCFSIHLLLVFLTYILAWPSSSVVSCKFVYIFLRTFSMLW